MKKVLNRFTIIAVSLFLWGCADFDNAPSIDLQPASLSSMDIYKARLTEPASFKNYEPPIETKLEESPNRIQPTLVFGTDEFTNSEAGAKATSSNSSTGEFTFNFVDADVRDVLRNILGDILGLNFVIDADVNGTVSLQTSRPIAREALLATIETVLRSNGAMIVEDGEVYRISSLDVAGARKTPLRARANGTLDAGYGVQVVPLRHIAASEMGEILELFAKDGSVLKIDKTRNVVMLAGSQSDREAFAETVALFDVDWMTGMSFGLFPLQYANAEMLVKDLQAVFGSDGETPLSELVRFIPISRLNALIAISPRAQHLKQAQFWIERLDQQVEGASQQIHVYYVQNVRAANLAEILSNVFDAPPLSPSTSPVAPGLVPASFERLDSEDGEFGAVEDIDSELNVASFGSKLTGGRSRTATGQNKDIRILADDATNSLIVLATPRAYRNVEKAIRRLDIVPLQVLVEATIMEVTLNDALKYGVQWFFESGQSDFTLSDIFNGAVAQMFPGFSYLFQGNNNSRVVVNALSEITDVKIISSPQLMVLDNQTAELQVGDQVPIATVSAISPDDANARIINSIEFRDTGVILRVTPRVNAGGLVLMEIEQEVSSVVNTTTSGIDSPTIQQRKIKSSVAIQSGETVSLGGLISESQELGNSGVPGISKVPILGALAGRKSKGAVRTELLVLITPRVIANQMDARAVTQELRDRMRALKPLDAEIF